jgi:hypothetical protein
MVPPMSDSTTYSPFAARSPPHATLPTQRGPCHMPSYGTLLVPPHLVQPDPHDDAP